MIILNSRILFLIIGLYIQLILSKIVDDAQGDELIFAHVIYRHGNRTTDKPYENDPYKDASFWPEGLNAITNVGKQTQFELGKYLRRRYDNLIGPGYSADKVYIRSSDTDRTIISALCNAAGLFPPTNEQMWSSFIDWQPVPVHTIPLDEDYIVYQSIPCDKSEKLSKENLQRPEITEKYDKFLKYLEKQSGNKMEYVGDAHLVFDPITTEQSLGFPLPDWAEEVIKSHYNTYEDMITLHWHSFISTTDMKKAKVGFLFKEIFDRLKKKVSGRLKQSLWIYSGHDNTIINFLTIFKVYESHIPPFAASVHLELYRNDKREYYVQLFYRTDKSEYMPPIYIPNCGVKCPLEKLFRLYADILPNENETYESLCRF